MFPDASGDELGVTLEQRVQENLMRDRRQPFACCVAL